MGTILYVAWWGWMVSVHALAVIGVGALLLAWLDDSEEFEQESGCCSRCGGWLS